MFHLVGLLRACGANMICNILVSLVGGHRVRREYYAATLYAKSTFKASDLRQFGHTSPVDIKTGNGFISTYNFLQFSPFVPDF